MKRMRKYLALALLPLLIACQSTVSDNSQELKVALSGDMLFEGANTLQGKGDLDLSSLAESLGVSSEAITKVGISSVEMNIQQENRGIVESLLFQVVSNNQELSSVASLSPLPETGVLKLNVAEEVNLLPYMKDEGLTYVLDLNISEDHMDEMMAKAKLALVVEYKDEK